MRIAAFAEIAMFKRDMKGPREDERGNVSSNFQHGIYIGFDRRTSAHKFLTLDGGGRIMTSRHLMRVPDPERWSREKIEAVTLMPWEQLFGRNEAKIEETTAVEAPEERKNEKKARQFYVMPHLLAEFGYTHTTAHSVATQ